MLPVFVCEPLSARRYLAGTAVLESSGLLRIVGDTGSNRIVVSGPASGLLSVTIDGQTTTFAASDVASIAISGLAGNDRLDNQTDISSEISGGSGNDTIVGGQSSDTLLGRGGNDLLVPTSIPRAGAPNEANVLSGDAGNDRVFYGNRSGPLDVVLGIFNVEVRVLREAPQSAVDDEIFEDVELIQLSQTNDEIDVLGGNGSSIDGLGGDDLFTTGDDYGLPSFTNLPTLYGGKGDDRFDSNDAANDYVFDAGAGDDFFDLGNGSPTLFGGAGKDVLSLAKLEGPFTYEEPRDLQACNGIEVIKDLGTSLANMSVISPDDSVTVVAASSNAGAITIFGGAGDDSLIGGDSNDSLVGGDGDDTLRGGDGDDTLSAGGGRDRLYGDAGDDLLLARGGSRDRVDGGNGTDTATRDNGPSVFDQLFNIETES